MSTDPKVQKALDKLDASIASGQAYEGHEMFKTAFHRFRARKQTDQSYILAEQGAKRQFTSQQGQPNCGAELCTLLIEAWETDNAEPTQERVNSLVDLVNSFPSKALVEGDEPPIEIVAKVTVAGEKWLRKSNALQYIPSLEGALANKIMQCFGWKGMGAAMLHYAQSTDMQAFANALHQATSQALPQEEDLILCRAALQTASSRSFTSGDKPVTRARQLIQAYVDGSTTQSVLETPTMHMTTLLLEAFELKNRKLVGVLLEKYSASVLDRDRSNLEPLIERCKDKYLPYVPQPGGGLNPMMMEMFGSLLGGGNRSSGSAGGGGTTTAAAAPRSNGAGPRLPPR